MTDIVFVRRGQSTPRNKHGDKPGYYPERSLSAPQKQGMAAHFRGKSSRVSGGFVQANYALPYTVKSVFHRWVGTDSKGAPKAKASSAVFDAGNRLPPTPKGAATLATRRAQTLEADFRERSAPKGEDFSHWERKRDMQRKWSKAFPVRD